MDEFALIDRIRSVVPEGEGVTLGIGDDAAVLEVPAGHALVATTDTLNAGVHFPEAAPPRLVGYKALAVNLSDLAAMGAEPRWLLLNLSLEDGDDVWLDAFVSEFAALARRYGASLVGGDLTRGALSVTVTALGMILNGRMLTRSGARAGELVVVSGSLGDAALALEHLRTGEGDESQLMDRLHRPNPRVALGRGLVGRAGACIDLSDGLAADLGHIARASGVGAFVEVDRLPASEAVAAVEPGHRRRLQLTGGDDYELCFTWPRDGQSDLDELAQRLDVALTVIGRVTEDPGIRYLDASGRPVDPGGTGYRHFDKG